MTKFQATVLINTTRGSRYDHYVPDAVLAYDPAMVLSVEADTPTAAADRAFVIGNRMDTDLGGRSWPSWVRSVSVGDVVVLGDDNSNVTVWSVDGLGFTNITDSFDLLGPWNAPGGRAIMVDSGDASEEPATLPLV